MATEVDIREIKLLELNKKIEVSGNGRLCNIRTTTVGKIIIYPHPIFDVIT
jgi:hypothetical protein